MINLNKVIDFLVNKSLSIEEYFFLHNVREFTEDTQDEEKSKYRQNVKDYYQNNVFYGKDILEVDIKTDYNLMVEKLVKQEYLLDYRTDDVLSFTKLKLTNKYKEMIYSNDKEGAWERLKDLLKEYDAEQLVVNGNGATRTVYSINDSSQYNTLEKIVNYFWSKICKAGNLHELEKFFYRTELYLQNKGSLEYKLINYLINYEQGSFDSEFKDWESNSSVQKMRRF